MSVFSKALKKEIYNEEPLVVPITSSISRRVNLLGQTVLNGIKLIRSSFQHHEIKLLRSLTITVKLAFMKLIEDHEVIQECEECVLDKQVNHADQMHLMSLIQFIIHGLSPLDANVKSVQDAFKFFNQTNHRAVHERVEFYL